MSQALVDLYNERGPVKLFSDFLSIITIAISFVAKIPQILNVIKLQKAKGISSFGLLLELTSYTIMCSYNYRNKYELLSYMEYPIIMIQEYALICCVLYYKNELNVKSFLAAAIHFAMAGSFFLGLVSMEFITFLVPLCTPIGCSSKVIQLVHIIQTEDSESVSLLTWFISAFTNFTRIFTIYFDSADTLLLLNFTVSGSLSLAVLLTAYCYKEHDKED